MIDESIDRSQNSEWSDWTRSTTLVASSGDPSSPRPSVSTSVASQDHSQSTVDETDRGRPPANPTLLYGGGRHVPLTLDKATVVKQLVAPEATDLSRLVTAGLNRKSGSIYASCHSQDDLNSSVEEFRSANTSLEEEEPAASKPIQRLNRLMEDEDQQGLGRSQSIESDSSAE